MKIKVLATAQVIVNDLFSDIESGVSTNSYGERTSGYYAFCANESGNSISLQLTEETDGLTEEEYFYSLHLVDDITGKNCELYSANEFSKESVLNLAAEIIENCLSGLAEAKQEVNMDTKIRVPYISVWDGGSIVETSANVDIKTGEITDIESVEVPNDFDTCDREYVVMNDEEVDVIVSDEDNTRWVPLSNDLDVGCTASGVSNDKNYYVFVLGYDLLRDRLVRSNDSACDTSFERCEWVYEEFLKSGYNDDLNKSTYENLQRYVNDSLFEFETEGFM